MNIKEIEAKSILRKHKKIDSWFVSAYGMNLYRGCTHNCAYCDGRAETYYVEGEFGSDIEVKINAPAILERELDPARKRVPLEKCFILLGGGVGDGYQPCEVKYGLTRSALGILDKFGYPVHALTKSTLIKKDMDLFETINKKSRAIVSMSFSSVDEAASRVLEPGVPSPDARLAALRSFKEKGIATGMFLLPVVPGFTDSDEMLERAVSNAKDSGIDFIIFGHMTLKEGRQKDYFVSRMREHKPDIEPMLQAIYPGSQYGEAASSYAWELNSRFFAIAKKYKIALRIPLRLFADLLTTRNKIIVLLEQIDYLLKIRGKSTSFGYAAYLISQIKGDGSEFLVKLEAMPNISRKIKDTAAEIASTGMSGLYESLMGYREG